MQRLARSAASRRSRRSSVAARLSVTAFPVRRKCVIEPPGHRPASSESIRADVACQAPLAMSPLRRVFVPGLKLSAPGSRCPPEWRYDHKRACGSPIRERVAPVRGANDQTYRRVGGARLWGSAPGSAQTGWMCGECCVTGLLVGTRRDSASAAATAPEPEAVRPRLHPSAWLRHPPAGSMWVRDRSLLGVVPVVRQGVQARQAGSGRQEHQQQEESLGLDQSRGHRISIAGKRERD